MQNTLLQGKGKRTHKAKGANLQTQDSLESTDEATSQLLQSIPYLSHKPSSPFWVVGNDRIGQWEWVDVSIIVLTAEGLKGERQNLMLQPDNLVTKNSHALKGFKSQWQYIILSESSGIRLC